MDFSGDGCYHEKRAERAAEGGGDMGAERAEIEALRRFHHERDAARGVTLP